MLRVLAGCCVPLLGVGLSRCYLLNLYIGAWTRTPPRFPGALARFFPENIGLTLVKRGSARWNSHHNSNFHDGHHFRGCSHSFMFKLPYLLDLQVAPTSTASAIGQPGRLHHAMNVWLPYTNCGIATYPNRAIDMAGLSPARLRPFRPLPKTPVVTCILAKSSTGLLSSAKSNASTFLTLIARVILADHNYTFFGAQYRAYTLDSSGSRLPLPGLPAEFTTELLAKLYSGRTFTCWVTISNFIYLSVESQRLGFRWAREFALLGALL